MLANERRRPALIVFTTAFVIHAVILLAGGFTRGPVRIDEVHKLSETAFLGLLLSGDVSNDAWYCERVDRANPPAAKYVLGTGLLLTGNSLPPPPTLAAHLGDDDWVPPHFSSALTAPYVPLIRGARIWNTLLTACTGALVATLMFLRLGGGAALVAWSAFVASWLTGVYGTAATFEPVLTLFMVAALFAAALPSRAASAVAGAIAGLAVATRLSGGLALVGVVVQIALKPGRSLRQRFGLTAAAVAVAALTSILVDPFLWSRLPATACGGQAFANHGPTVLRPLFRTLQRLDDLSSLSAMLDSRGLRLPLSGRPGFMVDQVAAEPSGLVILLLTVLGLLTLPIRRDGRELPVAAAVMLIAYVLWLPYPWPRYVFTALPLMAILAGWGTTAAAAWIRERRRDPR